ncbi:MAG TPA: iron transporter [Bacteroidetes bacterium]|nr:iron transporter [Bacteroidota bacterium]
MNEATLNSLQPGECGVVENITTTDSKLKMRLLELGLIKGTTIELIRFAPLGDPIEIKIRGYRLSIRKVEAESIVLQRNK